MNALLTENATKTENANANLAGLATTAVSDTALTSAAETENAPLKEYVNASTDGVA